MQEQKINTVKQKIKKLLPKLKCAFHQNQTLTNFCSSKKCLLPLCPSCIKIHTIQHVNMKTDPEYENMMDLIINLNLQVKDFVSIYEQNHRYFTQSEHKITQFKQNITQNIQNLKNSIIQEVQRYFSELSEITVKKMNQVKYFQDLAQHKNQLKKILLILKKFDKNLSDQNVSGKFVIRNLIKYSSNNTQQILDQFDSFCKEFLSKIKGNFCAFSLRDHLKQNIDSFLNQVYKVTINQIPGVPSLQQYQGITNISQKLQQFAAQSKNGQKNQIKNSLSKVMSKVNGGIFSSGKKSSSQNQLNQTISYQKNKQNQMNEAGFPQISNKIFGSNHRRSFANHSSQRKNLNLSSNVSQSQNWMASQDLNRQNNYQSNISNIQKRSTSKGKGLSLIQPNYKISLQQSRSDKQSIRFSLSSLQNVNLELPGSKTVIINRRN